jgi:tetratricopeptide (TPR) repeat protein
MTEPSQNGARSAALEALVARVVDEFEDRRARGEAPHPEEYAARHPQAADEIRGVLGMLGLAAPQLAEAPGPRGVLGDFRIVREVGRGGMGVVYEAEQVSLGRRVALKVLPYAATMDPRQLQRFVNEARAAAALDHPHIVHVHAVGSERGVHYYAMQFIDGRTLAELIAELRRDGGRPAPAAAAQPTTPHVPGQPEPAAETAAHAVAATEPAPRDRAYFRRIAGLGEQAAEALDHAHQAGVVHRDVKPANLLLDAHGKLWVTDFGLAHVQSGASLTVTGDLVGTLRYMSPEQALAQRVVVDHRTDVYSLGATLYELLTLRPVFGGGDRQELLRQIAFEEPTAPRRLNKAVPAELETVVLKALEKNPADRYATAQELADDLGRFLADEPIRARPPSAAQRLRKWGRRHPAAVAAAAAALAAAVLALGGSLGWIAKDRDTRAALTAAEVAKALDDSVHWQGQGRVPEALAAARRALAALAAGGGDEALRRRVQARVGDLDLLHQLEEARLEMPTDQSGHYDLAFADRRYGEVFDAFGLEVAAWPAAAAGQQIAGSSVAAELAAFLDHWAELCRRLTPRAEARCRHLLAVARAADADGWRGQLRDALAGDDGRALLRLASSDEATRLLPWTWDAVGFALLRAGTPGPAEALLRKAQQRHPDDFWINHSLGLLLLESEEVPGEASRAQESVSFFRVCVALRPQSPDAHGNLGIALAHKGRPDEAIAEYQEVLRLNKDYAVAHLNLGAALYFKGRLDEAIAEYQEALRLNKDYAPAHSNLGNALRDKGRLDEAIAECKEAIRLNKDCALAHSNLGLALADKGRLDEAIAEYKEALRLNKDYAPAHNNLGNALRNKGQLDEAIAEYRQALRLQPRFAFAHYNLGIALQDKGQLDEAIAEFKEALRIKKDFAEAHNNLGNALQMKGALEKLPRILKGEARPSDAADYRALAWLCQQPFQGLYAASVRFYREAFASQPTLAEDLQAEHRYNAACAAALAGCGRGKDAAALDEKELGRLRRQALDWLKSDLRAWQRLLQEQPGKAGPAVGQTLRHWSQDPDFDGVRGAALARLSEAERRDWQQLWADVEKTLEQARGKPTSRQNLREQP